jgi:putative tricarboxylic transport membrane protein
MLAERVLALLTLLGGGLFLTQALALPFGVPARPGAGFFPAIVAGFACVVGLVATARAFVLAPRARAPRTIAALAPEQRNRVIVAVVLLVIFCALLPWVGYPIVACVFVALLLRRLGASWRGAVITGVLSALVSHYLFAVLLDVPLPRGPL